MATTTAGPLRTRTAIHSDIHMLQGQRTYNRHKIAGLHVRLALILSAPARADLQSAIGELEVENDRISHQLDELWEELDRAHDRD